MEYSIIMGVQLTIQDDDSFVLDEDDHKKIKKKKNLAEHSRSGSQAGRRDKNQLSSTTVGNGNLHEQEQIAQQRESDGRLVLAVEPSTLTDGCQRSKRTRRVVLFDGM